MRRMRGGPVGVGGWLDGRCVSVGGGWRGVEPAGTFLSSPSASRPLFRRKFFPSLRLIHVECNMQRAKLSRSVSTRVCTPVYITPLFMQERERERERECAYVCMRVCRVHRALTAFAVLANASGCRTSTRLITREKRNESCFFFIFFYFPPGAQAVLRVRYALQFLQTGK
jgi:hypothetical protein